MDYIQVGKKYRLTNNPALQSELFGWVKEEFSGITFQVIRREHCDTRCAFINTHKLECDGFLITDIHVKRGIDSHLCPYRTYLPQFVLAPMTLNELVGD